MNATEKKIVKLLKENKSQTAIANEVGVPRSMVQRVADKELGVDPASLKSLSTEQIIEIQALSKSGSSNRVLADKFNISAKTISRALMVRIQEEANNVVVISPIKPADEQTVYEVLEGGISVDKEGHEWYVGKFMENHNAFLCFKYNDDKVNARVFARQELKALESSSSSFNKENVVALAELSTALSEGYDKVNTGVVIKVVLNDTGESFPIRGALDARRRVGYFESLLGRTLRLALSSVSFEVTVQEAGEVVQEKKTNEDLGAKDLDVFLNEHQIMILPENIVIAIDGKPETITTSHPSYEMIVQAIKDRDIKRAYVLMKPREAIKQFALGLVNIDEKKITWNGYDISGTSVAKRIMALSLKGDYKNLERLTRFLDKMFQNPSATLVQSGRIYEFMAYSDIEIDDDGDIILYKSVRGNYLDKHSGTIDNTPGNIVRMSRSFVNDNNATLCSYGLHVCSLAYLKQCFGSLGQRVVRCKLNPKDIVSITNDFKSSKIRCCEYLVVDDYTTEYNRQHKSIDVDGLYR